MSEQKATNQGAKIWPDTSPPEGFMAGYANPPKPGKVRGHLGSAAPGAVEHALKEGSGRITKINEGTRAGVRKRIQEAIDQGMSPAEAGEYVRSWTGFDQYRAERIARTELMFSYNAAATRTYRDLGVTHVVADDGDEDEECAARHGQVFTVDEAEGIEDHPNGTLDWLPIEPTIGSDDLRAELHEQRPISSGAPAPTPPPPDPITVGAKQALAKMAQGVDIDVDEGKVVAQALGQGTVTQDEFAAAYKQLNKHKHDQAAAKQLLGKLNAGDDLTATEWDDLAVLHGQGVITEAEANAAMSQQLVMKQAKSTAQGYLDEMAQGHDLGWNQMKQLDDYVQQGVITQDQLNNAHLAKQAFKQKVAIDDAIQAIDGGYASDAQKQLAMDALGQGALTPQQNSALTQAIAKHLPKHTPAEVKQAVWDVTTPSYTSTQQQLVVQGIKDGSLPKSQQLEVAKGLVKQMQGGKPLDAGQQELATLLLDKDVMDPDIYLAAMNKLAGKLPPAPVQAPTPPAMAPAPAPAPVAAPKTTTLKGPGGAGGKDKFNPATFNPKDYPSREAWQRNTNAKLSTEARNAMRDYTNSSYHEMNALGRGTLAHYDSYQLARVKREVDLVRESMHPTTQDVLVRRGTTSHMFGPGGNTQISADEVMRLVQPGSEWVDGGFMSTSINRGHSWSGDILLELKVPKGTPAAWAQSISSHKREFEVLLDAGTRIVVESIERSPYGGQIKIVAHVKPR